MAIPPRKRPAPPPADDFGLLLEEGAEPVDPEMEDDELGDYAEDDLSGLKEDPLAAEGDLGGIDPEAAGLMERLGFSEPDQQQALVDLIKLLNGPPPAAPMEPPMGGSEMDMF